MSPRRRSKSTTLLRRSRKNAIPWHLADVDVILYMWRMTPSSCYCHLLPVQLLGMADAAIVSLSYYLPTSASKKSAKRRDVFFAGFCQPADLSRLPPREEIREIKTVHSLKAHRWWQLQYTKVRQKVFRLMSNNDIWSHHFGVPQLVRLYTVLQVAD